MEYTLIRTSRRSLGLQIDRQGDLIIRAPLRYSLENIEIFLQKKSAWIEKHQSIAKNRNENERSERGYYRLFGEKYLQGTLDESGLKKIYKDSLRAYLEKTLPSLLEGKEFRRKLGTLKINSARTRWGSCSTKGNISLSYRLAMYNEDTINAVIIHELAHLNHLDHSKRFWAQVYAWMPNYNEATVPLKQRVTLPTAPMHGGCP